MMEGGIKSGRSPSECLVCGDRASGRHYGVPSCDGCRGFFKRSVRRNLQYACKEGGRCTVDVARRNQCQACRLSKCLAVRMRKEAVQHERASRSQPKRRTVVAPPTAPPLAASYCETTVQYPGADDNNDMKKTTPIESKDCPTPRHAQPRWDPPLVAEESAARLLFLCVRWVRGLPSFLQLGFRDQAILLEEAWPDLFVISAAQFGFPIHEGFVSLASLQSRPLVASQLHHMKSVLSQLLSQQVDPTEFSCLKALALFRPEAMGLRDPLQVELLQDQTQLMLHEYVLTRGGLSPPLSTKVRFGKLLLSLAQLRRCSPQVIEELFFRRTIGSVPIERLLCDMFQAPNP